ncbi:putative Diguanylate cyclase [uncultured delta proteobacterium]|uniref:Putative Diguanylate cyclase n=1 Tax=uncultured delta proteobacterium TaxID=34034 RepID=A0A212JJS3_9DELT|nr:putative Diguanylate cyclase [uncultured delta proteobacterium]
MKKENKKFVKADADGVRNSIIKKSKSRSTSAVARTDASDSLRVMLDSTPLICAVCDECGRLIDCNLEMLRVLKVKSKPDATKHFFNFSPKYQYDGMASEEKGMRSVELALQTGFHSFEWEYLATDNERVPTETSLVRVTWNGGYRILVYSRDVRELQKQKKLTEERTAMMLKTLPLATFMISEKCEVIDCNEAAIHLFGANDKHHVLNLFLEDFSPQYQPNGELSSDKARNYMQQAFKEGCVTFEWMHKMANGGMIPAQVTLIRLQWNENEFVLSAYAQDLRDIKEAEQEMIHRSNYLKTVTIIAEWLLSSDKKNGEDTVEKSLEFIALNMNLNGAKIWMNTEQNGDMYYALYKSWPAEDAVKWPGSYAYNNLPFWKDSMLDNRVINSFVSDLPRAEQASLDKDKIKSILAVPLLVADNLWGFICFEDTQKERVFTGLEEQMLRSASSLIVSTIVRNRAVSQMLKNNRELRKKSYLMSSVNRVAELILGSEKSDFPPVIQRTMKLLGESVGANQASLWTVHYGTDAALYAKRLTAWQHGKGFIETTHRPELKVYDYIPEWDVPVAGLRDIENSLGGMNAHLRQLSLLNGNETLLLLPLVLRNTFWGFVAFTYEKNNHHTTEEERSILRSGSMMIAEAITRQEVTAILKIVEEKAATDNLTGLLTRTAFMQAARALFAESQRNKKPFSVLFMDLDHFKNVNDQHGHAFGDAVLVRFAEIIKASTRNNDLCCRYGGEEVVVVLADSDSNAAENVARRIVQDVREAAFESDKNFRFTVSVGMISAIPAMGEQVHTYIEKADLALYEAKNNGRNRIEKHAAIHDAHAYHSVGASDRVSSI